MTPRGNTTGKKRSTTATHKGQATRKRNDLTKRLKADLQATRQALKQARAAAREELKLANAAAKAEITVLKDQLAVMNKREKALLKIGEQKAKHMWNAGEKWEKEQISKIKKMFK